MIVYTRHAAVERIIDFMAKFGTYLCTNSKDDKGKAKNPPSTDDDEDSDDDEYEEEMNPFLLKLFTFCLDVSCVIQSYRFV